MIVIVASSKSDGAPSTCAANILVILSATRPVTYVRPNDSSPLSCPGQPCLTLHQYSEQNTTYFITGSTFVFLAGTHRLQGPIGLISIANITFRGEASCAIMGQQFTVKTLQV